MNDEAGMSTRRTNTQELPSAHLLPEGTSGVRDSDMISYAVSGSACSTRSTPMLADLDGPIGMFYIVSDNHSGCVTKRTMCITELSSRFFTPPSSSCQSLILTSAISHRARATARRNHSPVNFWSFS